jgi:hypothetical protein
MNMVFAITGFALAATATMASSQTVSVPSAVNPTAQQAVHSAGNAVALAPAAHELPAQAVAGTVPATLPFTQGVTLAGRALAKGTTDTGTNVGKKGLYVTPAGGVTPQRRAQEVKTVGNVATQAGAATTSAIPNKNTLPAIRK